MDPAVVARAVAAQVALADGRPCDWLLAPIDQQRDLTLDQILLRLAEHSRRRPAAARSTDSSTGMGSAKKSLQAAEQMGPDVAAARELWKVAQGGHAPGKPVFVDETGANAKLVRAYGLAPWGRRLVGREPSICRPLMGLRRPL